MSSSIDVEVYGTGPYRWIAYRDVIRQVASGTARNRLTLALAMLWLTIRNPQRTAPDTPDQHPPLPR